MIRRALSAIFVGSLVIAGAVAHNNAQSPSSSASPATRQLRQVAYLKASNPGAGDHFGCGGALTGHAGHGVAISGDGNTMAVSAFWEASNATGVNGNQADDSIPQAGAVYIFTRTGGRWSQQAYIKASNTGEAGVGNNFGDGDQFGFSPQALKHTGRQDWFGARFAMSGDGNTVAVAAGLEDSLGQDVNGRQNDESAAEAGAVYFFTRSGGTWAQQAYVKGSNTEAFDEFGSSVALSRDGRTMVAGARGEDSAAKGVNGNQADNSADEAGALYVFTYNSPISSGVSR